MRQALELSMTMAPARAAMGLYSRLTVAGVLERTMSMPANASGRSGSTGYCLPEVDGFTGAALGGEELDAAQGELVLDQHLPHDFADRTGRADHRNAWQHVRGPFVNGEQDRQSLHDRMERPAWQGFGVGFRFALARKVRRPS
jgi:hypothetical protein